MVFLAKATVVVLAALALSAHAFIDTSQTYVFLTSLTVQNVYGNGNQDRTDQGYAIFAYSPSSMTLQYWLYDNLSVQKTTSALYGPSSCWYTNSDGMNVGYQYDSGSNYCYTNVGTLQVLLSTLPTGPTVSSVTLNHIQESMLFDDEFYILISSTVYPNGHLGGHVNLVTYTPITHGFDQQFAMVDLAYLIDNTGEFPSESSSSGGNTGILVLWYYPNDEFGQSYNVYYNLFHSVQNPGELLLKCPNVNGVFTFTTTATNGLTNQQVQFTNHLPMLSELWSTGACYFMMTSAQFPNGEIYGSAVRYGMYEFAATGNLADFVSCMADFDMGSKLIGFLCYSNITADSVISLDVWSSATNNMLCSFPNVTNNLAPTPPPGSPPYTTVPVQFWCQLNETNVPDLANGKIYINVRTVGSPTGAVKATVQYNTQVTGYQYNSGGLSQGGVIAIAVVFSLLGVALIAGLVFFAYKKGWIDDLMSRTTKV